MFSFLLIQERHLSQENFIFCFRKKRVSQSTFLVPAVFKVPLAQNNPQAKVAYFGFTYSGFFHSSEPLRSSSLLSMQNLRSNKGVRGYKVKTVPAVNTDVGIKARCQEKYHQFPPNFCLYSCGLCACACRWAIQPKREAYLLLGKLDKDANYGVVCPYDVQFLGIRKGSHKDPSAFTKDKIISPN